jgi:hypothetical protein
LKGPKNVHGLEHLSFLKIPPGITYLFIMITLSASQGLVAVAPEPWPFMLLCFPPTNFVRSLMINLKYFHTSDDSQEVKDNWSLWDEMNLSDKDEYYWCLVMQCLISILILLVGVALHMNFIGWVYLRLREEYELRVAGEKKMVRGRLRRTNQIT